MRAVKASGSAVGHDKKRDEPGDLHREQHHAEARGRLHAANGKIVLIATVRRSKPPSAHRVRPRTATAHRM